MKCYRNYLINCRGLAKYPLRFHAKTPNGVIGEKKEFILLGELDCDLLSETISKSKHLVHVYKGWTIIFLSGGYHFWDLQTIFFQRLMHFRQFFFITFCNENNFYDHFFENVTGYSKILFGKITSCACIHMKVWFTYIRDGPLFFNQGVTTFGTWRQFFLKTNAFQTIFLLHFVMKTIFYDQLLKNVTGFSVDLIWKKTLLVHAYT